MLDFVKVENFRCFESVGAPLKPLTILVGPNDSGKTCFLDAIRRLSILGAGFDPSDFWLFDEKLAILIRAKTPDGEFRKTSKEPVTSPQKLLQRHLNPVGFYQLPTSGAVMHCTGYSDASGALELGSDGSQVPALLDYFLRRDRVRFSELVESLRRLVPGIEEIGISTPTPNDRQVDLVIENGVTIPADKSSAGVRLLLFFLALAYHPTPPKVILLEEPENGVHPKRLGDVMRLLREITRGEHGQPAQVILTTHSPYLMDHVDIEKDQILVFRRESDGKRTVQPANEERLKVFLDEFMLGEVWFNQSEEGLLGKPA